MLFRSIKQDAKAGSGQAMIAPVTQDQLNAAAKSTSRAFHGMVIFQSRKLLACITTNSGQEVTKFLRRSWTLILRHASILSPTEFNSKPRHFVAIGSRAGQTRYSAWPEDVFRAGWLLENATIRVAHGFAPLPFRD